MSGAGKSIDKEVKSWLRLRDKGKLTNAKILEKARKLNISYNSAMSLNTLGTVLVWCFDEERNRNSHIAQKYLEESCDIYSKALTCAPSCLWTRLQYCKKLLGFGEYHKIWQILNPIDKIQYCDDPADHNTLLPQEILSLSTGRERVEYVFDQYEDLKLFICGRLVGDLANKTIADRRKQVLELISITPKELRFHHINFLCCLWFAYNTEKDNLRRYLIQQSLDIVGNAFNDYKKSIVLSIYRARMLFALGHFADAERECIRGLEMNRPADPIVDGILYSMEINVHFDGEFQAKGDIEKDRVEYVKGHLKFLLRLISFRVKEHWDSLVWYDKDSFLTSSFDDLIEHYKEDKPSVQHALNNALTFFETHGQWDYWICPVCSEGLIMSIDELSKHLCSFHGYKSFDKPSSEQKCCDMFLWKYQKKLLLTLGDKEIVCNICPAKHTSFVDMKEARSRERSDCFSKFKTAQDNRDVSNKLWHQLMKACHISYCEYLVPFVRLYHRAKLLKDTSNVFSKRLISREDMNLVFSTAFDESKIHQEIEDRENDTLQVKYSELDNRFLQYWTEKQNRGYKWFPDADLPNLKEYKLTRFSNAAGDPMCKFTAQRAIDTQQQTIARRLIITDLKVSGSKSALNYAWMTGTRLRSPMVPCIVTLKKPKQEIDLIFNLLTRCKHPNILKPLGVWPDRDDPNMGYIILPSVDGAISKVSRNEVFLEDDNVIDSFSENGFKIFGDIISGVQYVNTHYSTPLPDGDEVLGHFPLNISLNSIYYIKDVTGGYQIYLGDFTVESSELNKVNVDELVTSNWNSVGIFLKKLCDERVVGEELTHLTTFLMGTSVEYDDLVWEPGMWTVSEKMILIREVFWIQRSYQERRDELTTRQPLGLELFAKNLSPDMVWKEQDMLYDFIFLRNKVLAHQDGIYHSYQGPKEDIGTKKATIEKLLRKQAPGCIIKVVEAIRALKWFILSPFRRSPDESQRWHDIMFPAPKHQQSGPAAQTPQQQPSSS